MQSRTRVFLRFCQHFLRYWMTVGEILIALTILICSGGVAFSFVENRSFEHSIYFAFITALSIGYGDISPQTTAGRVLSVTIGCVGMIFIGLTVAVATLALADTVEEQQTGSTCGVVTVSRDPPPLDHRFPMRDACD